MKMMAGMLLLALAGAARADTRYVHAGRALDVESGRVETDRLIKIVDGRVAAIAPWTGAPDGPVVDWSRFTVLPGLIDMHTHLADWGQTANIAEPLLHSAEDTILKGAANARVTLEAGFTTVHDVGCYRAFANVALRDAIERGDIPGPRINAVGAYLTAPGGGGEVTGLAPDVELPAAFRAGVVTGPVDARAKARNLLARGADSLKIIATGAVLTEGTAPGQLELSEEEMRAICEEAAVHGTYATAHAHGAAGIKAAIRAGVRSIEHASLIDDEGLKLAKERGIWLVMDIYNGDYIEEFGRKHGWPESHLRKNRETTDIQRERFRKAVEMGVPLAFGTDAAVIPHGTNAKQFAYMTRFGMTPLEAIRAATTVAARCLRAEKDVGSLGVGHRADMIAVEGDPTKDVSLLEHVKGVIKGGALVR